MHMLVQLIYSHNKHKYFVYLEHKFGGRGPSSRLECKPFSLTPVIVRLFGPQWEMLKLDAIKSVQDSEQV